MTHQTPTAQELLSRNATWARDITAANPNYFPQLAAEKQHPKVLWLGCADSRTSETTICACTLGDIFTHRNIANMIGTPQNDCTLSVIEYAVDSILVEDIVVVGHTSCGGVEAAWTASCNPGPIPRQTPLESWLAPLVQYSIDLGLNKYPIEQKGKALRILTEANARRQIQHILSLPMIQAAILRRKISFHAWVFEMETGRLIDVSNGITPKSRL